jgi:hypothetical protein
MPTRAVSAPASAAGEPAARRPDDPSAARPDAASLVAAGGPAARHGVVFVHGVGEQRKSDTLLDFGGPLVSFLQRWHQARQEPEPLIQAVDLSFAPVDVGRTDQQSCALLQVGRASWLLTEAWWATSNRRPGLVTMVRWSWAYLRKVTGQLQWAAWQRLRRLRAQEPDATQPALWARWVDLLNTIGLAAFWSVGAVIGYVVLLPLMLLAQVPIGPVQDFVLLRLVRPFLEINAGEFRTYLEDDLQAANMQRRVAAAIAWLVDEGGCDDVTIVAHSQGAVVSFGMLADPSFWRTARRVRKLITLGAGLNKAWLVRPELPRLRRPLPGHIHWLDLWSSYDPVPTGWLKPADSAGAWFPIFCPDAALIAEQHLVPRADPEPPPSAQAGAALAVTGRPAGEVQRYWPVSQQVTNEMNVIADHGAYWSNDEQVVVRLVAEIDARYHRQSRFWQGGQPVLGQTGLTPGLGQAIRARRERVSVLALARALGIAAWLAVSGLFWWTLARHGADFETGLAGLPPDLGWAGPLAQALRWLERLVSSLPLISDLLSMALGLPFWLTGSLLIGLICLALYYAFRNGVWEPWDRRARHQAIRMLATGRA